MVGAPLCAAVAQGNAQGALGYQWPGDAEPTLYRYELSADSGGGAVTEGTGTEATSITLPPPVFSALAHRVQRHAPGGAVEGFAEVAMDQGALLVAFERRLSLALLGLAGALAIVGALVLTVRRERGRRSLLVEARRREVESREAERLRLAREIHDGPVQLLHLARLNLASSDTGQAGHPAAELNEAVVELRAIAEGLRPPALGPFGLKPALEDLVTRFRERNPELDIDVSLEDDAGRIGEAGRLALFRVAQEALSNAANHARATHVSMRLGVDTRGVELEIRDNGRGGLMDSRRFARCGRYGLLGMHERAELVCGSLEIRSPKGVGTRIRLRAPWSGLTAAAQGGTTE
jgi:signal transduction histidine kinase